MPAEDTEERVRNSLLGEIETEVVGMQHHKAKLRPGEQVNLERESKNSHDRCAVRVENGHFEPVGYLPKKMASWLAPLIDGGKVHLDGYVPQCHPEVWDESSSRRPLVLSVFQCEKGHGMLDKAEPKNELEALHQTVLQAYQSAQGYRNPELILGLAKGLQPLESQELLPETRLLLALLPAMAREARMSQGMRATVKFRELLGTLVIGEPSHHHNLTFFPLIWPESHKPSYTLLSKAIEKGMAVVEEVNESGSVPNLAVTNKAKQPLLIPEGEILMGAKQNRVINVTVLVAAGVKFILPVSCVEQGRWRYKSRHFESKFCAPPSLRHKKLKAVHRNRSEHGVAASDQAEVWNEVQACLSETAVRSETSSLTDAFVAAEEKLKEHCKRMVLPKGASGVLVGRHDRIIGMDLFDSPMTLKTLWNRLSDAYFFDALRDPAAASPTPAACPAVHRSPGQCGKAAGPGPGLGRRTGNRQRRTRRCRSALRWWNLSPGRIQRRRIGNRDGCLDGNEHRATAPVASIRGNAGLCSYSVPMLPQSSGFCHGRSVAPGTSVDSAAEVVLQPLRYRHQGHDARTWREREDDPP